MLTASFNGTSLTAKLLLQPTYLRATGYTLTGSTTNSTPPNTTGQLSLTWNSTTTNSFQLSRYNVSSGVVAGTPTYTVTLPASQTYYNDTTSVTSGNTYYYKLTDASMPVNFLSDDMVVPYMVSVADNQTVDSRIDPRFATVHYLDYPWGTSTYHGGLYVGYAQDNAQISRSLLKFNLTRPATGDFQAGAVNAFMTGAVTSGTNTTSFNVGCQAIANSSWTSANAAWSQIFGPNGTPGSNFSPAAAVSQANVTMNPASPNFTWCSWPLNSDIMAAANSNSTLSVALASMSESSNGWAYFGKSGYVPGAAPCVTYLYDYVVPITLTLSPNQINGVPSPITATVTLNGIGLGDSQNVTMTVSPNPANAFTIQNVSPSQGFPYTLPANGFLSSRTFSFMANVAAMTIPCGNLLNYTVTATCNGVSASANLQIVLPPCPH